jgi:hypothetical protein
MESLNSSLRPAISARSIRYRLDTGGEISEFTFGSSQLGGGRTATFRSRGSGSALLCEAIHSRSPTLFASQPTTLML